MDYEDHIEAICYDSRVEVLKQAVRSGELSPTVAALILSEEYYSDYNEEYDSHFRVLWNEYHYSTELDRT